LDFKNLSSDELEKLQQQLEQERENRQRKELEKAYQAFADKAFELNLTVAQAIKIADPDRRSPGVPKFYLDGEAVEGRAAVYDERFQHLHLPSENATGRPSLDNRKAMREGYINPEWLRHCNPQRQRQFLREAGLERIEDYQTHDQR
jgi:hypothetical protein